MSKPIHVIDEKKVLTFANNLIALLGLLVLGFPVTSATIKTIVISWALLMVAAMQLVSQVSHTTYAISGDAS
jgi:uncharacterized membrane protein HdeD (DUF308 family)